MELKGALDTSLLSCPSGTVHALLPCPLRGRGAFPTGAPEHPGEQCLRQFSQSLLLGPDWPGSLCSREDFCEQSTAPWLVQSGRAWTTTWEQARERLRPRHTDLSGLAFRLGGFLHFSEPQFYI